MDDSDGRHHPATDDVDDIAAAWARELPGAQTGSIAPLTRLRRIAKLLDAERRRVLEGLGVTPATLDLLSTLRRAGAPYRLAPSELGQRSLVTAGAITQRVALAERDGLVTRTRSVDDARRVVVELTPAGHALIERVVGGLLAHEATLLDALDPSQREHLTELLRVLHHDLTGRVDLNVAPASDP